MINITRMQGVLLRADYKEVADNDPSIYVLRSPHSNRPIIFQMNVGMTFLKKSCEFCYRTIPL